MKRTLLFICITAISMIAKANHQLSDLSIKMFNNSLIAVSVDNGPLTLPAGKQVLKDINPGNHLITVFKKSQFNYPPHIIFSKMVFVPAGVKMRTMINQHLTLKVIDLDPKMCQATPPVQYNNYYNACNSNWMSNDEFEQLRASIDRQSFDDTQYTIAMQGIRNREMTSRQIAILMNAFTFESTKLDFAKQAYNYVIDKEKYYLVNNEFTFSSSIDELNKYLFG